MLDKFPHIFSEGITRLILEIKEVKKINEQYLIQENPSSPAKIKLPPKIKKEVQARNDRILKIFQTVPNEKVDKLFTAFTQLQSNQELLEAGLASDLVGKKNQYIRGISLQQAYANILPKNNVKNLKFLAPISNPLLLQILSNKSVLYKLTNTQIKETFESAAFLENPYDERIDFAIKMLETDFLKVMSCISITHTLVIINQQLQLPRKELKPGDQFFKNFLFDLIIKEICIEKNSKLLEQTKKELSFSRNPLFKDTLSKLLSIIDKKFLNIQLDVKSPLFKNEIQKSFENYLKLDEFSNQTSKIGQRSLPVNNDYVQKLFDIYYDYHLLLEPYYIKMAFNRSIELTNHKGLRNPFFARIILQKSSKMIENDPQLLLKAFRHFTYFKSHKKLNDETLAFYVLIAIEKQKNPYFYDELERIYKNICVVFYNESLYLFDFLNKLHQVLHSINSKRAEDVELVIKSKYFSNNPHFHMKRVDNRRISHLEHVAPGHLQS